MAVDLVNRGNSSHVITLTRLSLLLMIDEVNDLVVVIVVVDVDDDVDNIFDVLAVEDNSLTASQAAREANDPPVS